LLLNIGINLLTFVVVTKQRNMFVNVCCHCQTHECVCYRLLL